MSADMKCGCRCIKCKSSDLESFLYELANDDYDMHHTCRSCSTHFDHLDGTTFEKCEKCGFTK